jgi:Phosphotransferase enzyme family
MGVADSGAVAAAVAAARALGLRVDDPVVLRDRLNVLVWLKPAPVVARVAGTIAAVRPGDEWLLREVAVAGALAGAGAPIVAPSGELPPGPHLRDGRLVSFWTHVPAREGPIDPVAAGEALRACHEALRSFAGSLPLLGVITEAESLLARLTAEGTLEPAAATELQQRFDDTRAALENLRAPVQPLHADAHLGNVLNGPAGPLWNDWEDTCLGPVGWDAACLVSTARLTGEGVAEAEAALAATEIALDPGELALWVEARTLQGIVWISYVAREHPERRAALEPWLQAARLGD